MAEIDTYDGAVLVPMTTQEWLSLENIFEDADQEALMQIEALTGWHDGKGQSKLSQEQPSKLKHAS